LDSGSVSRSDSWLILFGSDSGSALSFTGELVSATPIFIPVSSLLVKVVLEPPSRFPLGQNVEDWPASSTGLVSGFAASMCSGSATPAGLGLAMPAGSGSAMLVSSLAIPSSSEALPGPATPLVSVSASGLAHPLVVPVLEALNSVLSTGLVSGSATPAESSPFYERSLDFGLFKSQIWLLERIKDRLKIHEEVKDEDHSTFLKEMEEEFHWINLVAREQGRLLVDEEDIRWICVVACEDRRWEVDKELDDRKIAWLNEMKEELRLTVEWPGPKGKIISL
jgi:hypothetical protein